MNVNTALFHRQQDTAALGQKHRGHGKGQVTADVGVSKAITVSDKH